MAEDASNGVAVAGSAATAASAGVAMSAATLFGVWIHRSEMVAVIGDLERDGLVARVRDEQDRRRNVVRLTLAGADTLKQLDARVEEAQRALLEPLSADERRELQRLLTGVVEHHRSLLRDAPPPSSR